MLDLKTPIHIDPSWLPDHAVDELAERHHASVRFSRGEKKMLRRKRVVKPSEWAARHIMVPADSPTGKRYWDPDITPYWSGPMDASFYHSVQEISVCAVPQSGKSQFMSNCIGYTMDRVPGNVILVMPDEKLAGEFMQDRLVPMINDSPKLASYNTGYVDDLTATKIKLRHVKLYPAWATSASRQASKPAPYAVLDEENKYPVTANKQELAPVDLMRMRGRNFQHIRKLWRASSPTIDGVGISKAIDESEVVFDYHVKCPACGALQLMRFGKKEAAGGMRWDGGGSADADGIVKGKSAWYECEKCSAKWDDARRNQAVRGGGWFERIADADGNIIGRGLGLNLCLARYNPIKIGFHVPAWLSPFVSLSECVAEYIRGLKDVLKFKAFCNNIEGRPWKIIKKERAESRILALRDDRPRGRVPGGGVVAALTAAVDTQDVGVWYEIRAWGWGGKELSKDSWCIREGYVESEAEIERILWEDEYFDSDGNRYVVALTIRDALGHRTAEVYSFCLKHRGKIFPSFGKDVMAQPFTWTNLEYFPGTKKPIPGGLKGVNVNTKYFKDELSRLLEINKDDPSSWRYHADFTEDAARQMTVEYVNEKGLWECPNGKANHLWDCSVLNLTAAEILGIRHWQKPEEVAAAQAGKPKRRILSKGING